MNAKSVKKALFAGIAGLGMLGMVGSASAAVVDINIYGASAQYLFWNSAAMDFLLDQGCTNVGRAQTADGKNGITRGTCSGDTVYIRYTSKASYDGIYAVKGQWNPLEAVADHQCANQPAQRLLADEATCTFTSTGDPGACSGTKCMSVLIGASDVAGESFMQRSKGALSGPLGGTLQNRIFVGIDTSTLSNFRPVVVPFAFFANDTVTRNGAPITNIPRVQAVMIFSGQVDNWRDFGTEFVDLPIVQCLRHAGSGTHATLDFAVMRGNNWGGTLITLDKNNGGPPNAYFNDGSADEMKCINGSGTWTGTGAIGYADADQSLTSYGNVVRLKYNGEEASKYNVVNGLYNFWSAQWLFTRAADATSPWVVALTNFASDATNIPLDKQAYWASQSEMKYKKTTDKTYVQPK